jgi:hypothetical protein
MSATKPTHQRWKGRDADLATTPKFSSPNPSHKAKVLMKKRSKSLSEIHQHPPSQADRSQTLKRVEIITIEAGAKIQGITLGHRGCLSSARLEFCGSFEEFR